MSVDRWAVGLYGLAGILIAFSPFAHGGVRLAIFGLILGVAAFTLSILSQKLPRVILNGNNAFHTEYIERWGVDVLCMRLINIPKSKMRGMTATNVSAHFRCEGRGTDHLPSLDARWSDTVEPPNLLPNEVPQLAVDMTPGSGRQINLLVKKPSDDRCYLFNNDSYIRGLFRPEWALEPGEYTVTVKVTGDKVTESFKCRFVNHENAGLEVQAFLQQRRSHWWELRAKWIAPHAASVAGL